MEGIASGTKLRDSRCSGASRVRVKGIVALALLLASCMSVACGREGPLRIHHVQGAGDVSPHEGSRVSLDGVIVTAIGGRGFFVQEPDHRTDDDPRTSEGLYVYGQVPGELQVGHRVAIQGEIIEFHGHTQLKPQSAVRIRGRGEMPSATRLRRDRDVDLESLESMRVTVRNGLIVSPSDRHGEVRFVPDGSRPVRLEGPAEPGPLPEMDPAGLGGSAPELAAPRTFSADGVLVYRFDDYVLWPTRLELGASPQLPRPVRAARSGELAVASYNLRLFFDEVRVAGEPVVDAETFQRRLAKHAGWLEGVLRCPDVVAVQEVETPAALTRLAGESRCGYRAFAGEGHAELGLGYLIGPAVKLAGEVRAIGAGQRMPGAPRRLFDRPPLKAVIRTAGGPVTLINVHLRSMRGLGREPRVAVKRRAQAEALNGLVEDARASGERVLVLGDFNALPFDDGYVDVLGRAAGEEGPDRLVPGWRRLKAGERYSYVYRGHAQMLDHALIDPALDDRVTGMVFARGNADAPAAFADEAGTELRASDHDPFVIFLRTAE